MTAPAPIGVATCGLARALLALLPGAVLASRKQTAWHSATFSGERVVILLDLAGAQRRKQAKAFAKALPEAEFHLRRQLVADIHVSALQEAGDVVRLTVEALLLDE